MEVQGREPLIVTVIRRHQHNSAIRRLLKKPQLHVFAGSFPSRDDACLYTEAQWEREPDDSISDEDYAACEERNPTWAFRNELGDIYLDVDFIETIDGPTRYDYLST